MLLRRYWRLTIRVPLLIMWILIINRVRYIGGDDPDLGVWGEHEILGIVMITILTAVLFVLTSRRLVYVSDGVVKSVTAWDDIVFAFQAWRMKQRIKMWDRTGTGPLEGRAWRKHLRGESLTSEEQKALDTEKEFLERIRTPDRKDGQQ